MPNSDKIPDHERMGEEVVRKVDILSKRLNDIFNEDLSITGLFAFVRALAQEAGGTIAIMDDMPAMRELLDKIGSTPHQLWDELFATAMNNARKDLAE